MERREFLRLAGLAPSALAMTGGTAWAADRLISQLMPVDPDALPDPPELRRSICGECPAQCGVRVRVRAGHPVKLEGEPDDPLSRGGLCIRGQAALGRLYHPERVRQPLARDAGGHWAPISWDDALQRIDAALIEGRAQGAAGVYLSGRTTGALSELIDEFGSRRGVEILPELEPLHHGALRGAYAILTGSRALPAFRFHDADFAVTLGADLFGTFIHPVRFAADFAAALDRSIDWHHLEPHLSITGCSAPHRWVTRPTTEDALLACWLRGVAERGTLPREVIEAVPDLSAEEASRRTGVPVETVREIGERLRTARRPLVLAGDIATAHSGGLRTAVLAGLLQFATGQIGTTVDFAAAETYDRVGTLREVGDRARAQAARPTGVCFLSRLHTLAGLPEVTELARRASLAVAMTDFLLPPTEAAALVLPLSHPLESSDEVEVARGRRLRRKPVFRPLFDTRTEGDILLGLLGASASYEARLDAGTGGASVSVPAPVLQAGAVLTHLRETQPPIEAAAPSLLVLPSLRTFDGRSRVIPLLHEIPDPVSVVTYGSYVGVADADAARLGVENGHHLILEGPAGRFDFPARRQPGLPEGVVTVALDALLLDAPEVQLPIDARTGEWVRCLPLQAIRPSGVREKLPILSTSMDAHGREIVPEAGTEHAARTHDGERHTLYPPHEHHPYRWGMVIDLARCTGCSACVAACYLENNIPIVGPKEHRRGREMSWLRIQPYLSGDRPLLFTPMLCQHCDDAPCESVCPVYATYHNPEGLNVQVYNRCVGTRYCSNNCPYKVRRFNWYPHPKEAPLNLLVNPDVRLRPKGVMEKCTFCMQRIRDAKDHAKDLGREVRDGEVLPACAQSCPSRAIVFGNLQDPNSRVAELARSPRAYRVLESLGTEPAVRYLREDLPDGS
jgi:molybdopterin-containing oxidoreductase family iron-sulfur binding subunit